MENPYNEVPYQGSPFPQAHIHRLATNAHLAGLDPPDVRSCRVLELGCGDGAHLIPMAMEFPESQFVGIDLAEMPIARASDLARELGLDNITFRTGDVAQLSGQPGECDYLIAHGLYSWVPPAVQDKILELAGRLLAPSGVAYISYNAYPAWHIREMTRNMARIHTAGLTDPVEMRNRTITLLAAIYRSQEQREPYRETVRAEMERVNAKEPYLFFHDDLAEHASPVYFSQLVKRAAAHGLQYLSDAEPANTSDIAPDVLEALNQITDIIEWEQFYDFLTLRGFRRTLLCRADCVLHRDARAERLKQLHFAAALKPETAPDLSTFAPAQFNAINGSSITVNQPFVKAVLWELAQAWPASVTFDTLVEKARAIAPLLSPAEGEDLVREVLTRLHLPGVLEISVHPYPYPRQPSERPAASKLARLQLRNASRVTSLRHRPVDLDNELAKALLPLLDGTRDRETLAATLNLAENRTFTAEQVDQALQRLCELSLLIA